MTQMFTVDWEGVALAAILVIGVAGLIAVAIAVVGSK
jgi:hypothetical protein